jgi:hypothetical protein
MARTTLLFYSPLAQSTKRICPDYTVYIKKFNNGNVRFVCYDGASPKPYVYIRSTSADKIDILLKTHIPQYQKSGCKMVTLKGRTEHKEVIFD